MQIAIYEKLGMESPVAIVVISVATMLFFGFAMTRITKRLRLPNVTAYIIAGILIGPYCFNLIPSGVYNGLEFISDIALAFIAFSTGEFFRISALKKNGIKTVVITLFEALFASLLVFVVTYLIIGLPFVFSLVLSALAAATAPASTMMTIRQTCAKGDFVDTLLQVIALDNVVALIAYSVAISVALSVMGGGEMSVGSIFMPMIKNIGVLVLGGLFGFLMKLLMPTKRSTDNRLIIAVAVLFTLCGVCALLDVSPLLGCMSMGMIYINVTDDVKLFKQLNYFAPPFLMLFFVRSGIGFKLGDLFSADGNVGGVSILLISVIYFFVRVIGKYLGAFLGSAVVKKKRETRNYLGLALIPQASVAIGLAALCARALGDEVGGTLQSIIVAAGILYELAGPACAKLSLYLSGACSKDRTEAVEVPLLDNEGKPKNSLEILIEKIEKIKKELPEHSISEEEQIFTEAAEEMYEYARPHRRSRFINKN